MGLNIHYANQMLINYGIARSLVGSLSPSLPFLPTCISIPFSFFFFFSLLLYEAILVETTNSQIESVIYLK